MKVADERRIESLLSSQEKKVLVRSGTSQRGRMGHGTARQQPEEHTSGSRLSSIGNWSTGTHVCQLEMDSCRSSWPKVKVGIFHSSNLNTINKLSTVTLR